MKLLIGSDLHGSYTYTKKLLERAEAEGTNRILLLGDILYHGPRNELPDGYDPKAVFEMLNAIKDRIWCVRGNCDAEVDQMVLEFPIMADYAILPVGNKAIYATHGHIHNEDALPPLQKGDVLLHGHTHLYKAEKRENYFLLNPGSTSLPKGGNPRTYGVLEDGVFRVVGLDDGQTLASIDLEVNA